MDAFKASTRSSFCPKCFLTAAQTLEDLGPDVQLSETAPSPRLSLLPSNPDDDGEPGPNVEPEPPLRCIHNFDPELDTHLGEDVEEFVHPQQRGWVVRGHSKDARADEWREKMRERHHLRLLNLQNSDVLLGFKPWPQDNESGDVHGEADDAQVQWE